MEYLCVVVDNKTNKTLAEYEVQANNEPFARWKATQLFRDTSPAFDLDWVVDVLKLD